MVPFYFALNERGLAAIKGALTAVGMVVPFMEACVDVGIPAVNSVIPSISSVTNQQATSELTLTTMVEKKEQRRKLAEMRIARLVSTNAEIVMHVLDSVLVNGEINSSHFRSRMMAFFESKKTSWTAAPAFKDFLITAVLLGNYTSSAEPQKSSDKQSVRFDDFVPVFNPQNASDVAVVWEAIESFRNCLTTIDTEFGLALSVAIRAWIAMLRSGSSPSNIVMDYLLIINRRKFAALGLLLQDSASESVSDEDAKAALEVWASWDRMELEQECTDFIRNKRSREKDESIAKKQKLDSIKLTGRGGSSQVGSGGAGEPGVTGAEAHVFGLEEGFLLQRSLKRITYLPHKFKRAHKDRARAFV